MIIDSLVHVTPDGRWFDTRHDASQSRLLREMDRASVDQAVIVALAEYIANDFVLDVCRRHPGRLIPGASFNPAAYADDAQAAREFRGQLKDGPFAVLKLHPRLNRYDPLDPRCLAVLDELATWERPLAVWLDSLFYFRGGTLRKPPVDTIHEIVSRFPRLRFVILHGGGTWLLHVVEAVADCANAMVDLSWTLCRYGETSLAADLNYVLARFDRRTVCGSDFPEYVMSEVVDRLGRATAGLASEKKANILGTNLENLLALGRGMR